VIFFLTRPRSAPIIRLDFGLLFFRSAMIFKSENILLGNKVGKQKRFYFIGFEKGWKKTKILALSFKVLLKMLLGCVHASCRFGL
jgi:hypothetical protein